MTIAISLKTGAVVGQVTGGAWHYAAYGRTVGSMQLLTRTGHVTVDASTVRLEKMS
jgi:hypothetical protein